MATIDAELNTLCHKFLNISKNLLGEAYILNGIFHG